MVVVILNEVRHRRSGRRRGDGGWRWRRWHCRRCGSRLGFERVKGARVHAVDRPEFGDRVDGVARLDTVTPSALSEFSAAVSVASSTSVSLKTTETPYVVAASDRRLDAAVAMHAPSELESAALV